MEEWRPIPGFPHYEASSEGRIRSLHIQRGRGRVLRVGSKARGYQYAGLCEDGRMQYINVHSLVLTTFVGPRPNDQECRHLNSDPSDNRVVNLAWGTRQENTKDRMERSGRLMPNNAHPLTEWRIHQDPQMTQTDLARGVGVTAAAICQIETRYKRCSMGLAATISAFTRGAVPMSSMTEIPNGARL